MAGARIQRARFKDIGPFIWVFSRLAGRVAGTEPPGVFLTLGRNRRLFWGWLHFAGRLMPGGRFTRRETELVILRVAARAGSAYEWSQHASMGAKAGLTAVELKALAEGDANSPHAWAPRDQMLVRVTDELFDSEDLSDATWTLMRSHLDDRLSIELVMLVGHYRMLATALKVFRVQEDAPR